MIYSTIQKNQRPLGAAGRHAKSLPLSAISLALVGLIGASLISENAQATTFYTADSSNATTSTVGLSAGNLGSSTISNPSGLTSGSYNYNYAAIIFTSTTSGMFTFGQTFANADTVMILYSGVYDPSNPGAGGLVGNDDTDQANHESAIGSPTSVSCSGSSGLCPQISYSITAGITYTLFVSTFSPGSSLVFPFQFYSTGDVVFGIYSGRTPIDLMQPYYLSSELGVTVDPSFVGGTLKMDLANGIYTDDFTLANITTSTIDQNGNHSVFEGILSDATSGIPGSIVIDNTGTGGSVTFNAVNTYTGTTTINTGATLVIGDSNYPTAALSGGGDVIVNTGGTLGGYGSIAGNVNNTGIVAPGSAASALTTAVPFGQLTIQGDYIGNNGVLRLNAILGDDTSSLTDKLAINGNASGTTYVVINSLGGIGGQTVEGIKIIDVGGTSTDNAFVQSGRIVAGTYEYSLVKGATSGLDPQSWYLTSQYLGNNNNIYVMRPEGGSYIANLSAANTMFNTRLHDRLGETQYTDLITGQDKVTSMWIRYDYGHNRFEDNSGQTSTKSDRSLVQIGGDIAQWSSNGRNRFHLGVMGGYGRTDSDTNAALSGYSSSGKVEGYSVGLYGTWYANQEDKSGLYIDGWLLWNDMNAKVHGQGLYGESYDIKGVTASLEAGYALQVGQMNENYGIWIQPQAQITWMGMDADDHIEYNGTFVKSNDNNVQTRLGARAYLSNINSSQAARSVVQPYLELNWIHNTKRFNVSMDGTKMRQDGAKDVGEVRLGVEANINQNTSLWLHVGHQMGSDSYRDTTAQFGLKYSF